VTLVRYQGAHAGTLSDYLDLETSRTLTVEPGGVYDVAPASGRLVPGIPGGCVVLEGYDLAHELKARGAQPESSSEDDGAAGESPGGEPEAEASDEAEAEQPATDTESAPGE
jgi:hypothetical protein